MEKRLNEINDRVRALDGSLDAKMMGLEIDGQVIVNDLKYLLEKAERQDLALKELKDMQKAADKAGIHSLSRDLKSVIDLLEGNEPAI